ncbi:hypothetical protein CCP4SC76_2940001 [Gammaproteobacteria bacterium]
MVELSLQAIDNNTSDHDQNIAQILKTTSYIFTPPNMPIFSENMDARFPRTGGSRGG